MSETKKPWVDGPFALISASKSGDSVQPHNKTLSFTFYPANQHYSQKNQLKEPENALLK